MNILSKNRKALFNYEILEKFDAGIVLLGHEVKSIRLGRMNLSGSHVTIEGQELFLVGSNIPPYQPKNCPSDYNPERSRKLLLTKKEIIHLIGKSKQRGLTLVPLKVYTTKSKIKIEFAVAKGKKKFDKREKIKKQEVKRKINRALKN